MKQSDYTAGQINARPGTANIVTVDATRRALYARTAAENPAREGAA